MPYRRQTGQRPLRQAEAGHGHTVKQQTRRKAVWTRKSARSPRPREGAVSLSGWSRRRLGVGTRGITIHPHANHPRSQPTLPGGPILPSRPPDDDAASHLPDLARQCPVYRNRRRGKTPAGKDLQDGDDRFPSTAFWNVRQRVRRRLTAAKSTLPSPVPGDPHATLGALDSNHCKKTTTRECPAQKQTKLVRIKT